MPLPINLQGEEAQANSTVKEITKLAMGVPLILDSAPTTANGLLPEGRWGIFGTNLYLTSSNNTYRWALTLV